MTRRRESYSQWRIYRGRATRRSVVIRRVGRYVGPKKGDMEKEGAYECGFEPYDDARRQFNIRYYQVAIRFLVFDLEVCYRYPWIVNRGEMERPGYRTICEFRRELVVGYMYVWIVGALELE